MGLLKNRKRIRAQEKEGARRETENLEVTQTLLCLVDKISNSVDGLNKITDSIEDHLQKEER